MSAFPTLSAKAEIEEGVVLAPKFDRDGLVTCVTTDATTGEAWYFSRSRNALWRKGESSGRTQRVVEMRVDCDQDAIWIKVNVGGDGGCCHTGRHSCFYRIKPVGTAADGPLAF